MIYAEILPTVKTGPESLVFTYKVPADLETTIKVGQLVKIPLRRRSVNGIILKLTKAEPNFRTSDILAILDESPILTPTYAKLLRWISEYYFCTLSKALQLLVPKNILGGRKLRKKETTPLDQKNRTKLKELTDEQKNVLQSITESQENNFLIQGITGSGKTELYVHLAQKTLEAGKQVLIMVPEISLTPQTIDYFEKALGIKAAVINSKILETDRRRTWIAIKQGEIRLVIGSRSAIFSPFEELGMAIIDEEHDGSYKQDNSPRYHIHAIINKLQELNPELKVVYGSATPSVETAYRLTNSTLKLTKRIAAAVLPEIVITDLREEFHKRNFSIFSELLKDEITKSLSQKEQIILFLNRRGAASSLTCRDCGESVTCNNCDTPMTYHNKTLKTPCLICHHCGNIGQVPATCNKCKGPNIKFFGIGTQKIEESAINEFPGARVLRADKDTTSQRDSFEQIYNSFKNHEADILVGTQMISKGLNLPKVSLVGVVLADIGLNIADFRSAERNFQLITQVAGRAGRAQTKGKVIIQTYFPESPVLEKAKSQNFENFYQDEIIEREKMQNPPFSELAKITIEEKTFERAKQRAEELEAKLWQTTREKILSSEILDITSYPAYLTKLKEKYRYVILIKTVTGKNSRHKLLVNLGKEDIMNPNIKIDIDPISIT